MLTRRRAGWLLALYLCAVLVVVFEPLPFIATGAVDGVYRLVQVLGLTHWISTSTVEFVLNVLMFVPLTFLGAAAAPRLSWRACFGLGVLASAVVELSQLLVLAGRSGSLLDLTSNSLGALIGALLAHRLQHRPEHRLETIGCAHEEPSRPDEE